MSVVGDIVGWAGPRPRPGAGGTRRRRLAVARWAGGLAVLGLVYEFLLAPDLARSGKSLYLLGRVNLAWVALGLALEALALVADARLTGLVLGPQSPPLSQVLRANVWTLAVGHVVPGGTGPSTVAAYRVYTGLGTPGATVAPGLAVRGVGSALILNIIFWLALAGSVAVGGRGSSYEWVAIGAAAAALALGSALVARAGLARRAGPRPGSRLSAVRLWGRRWRRRWQPASDRLGLVLADRPLLLRAGRWSMANWLLDASSLWVFLAAFGHPTMPLYVLAAYGLANVLAAIPVTPSGLGVVEGTLVPALACFGVPDATALLGVLAYRVVAFWLPVPIGCGCYLSLRPALKARRPPPVEAKAPDRARERGLAA